MTEAAVGHRASTKSCQLAPPRPFAKAKCCAFLRVVRFSCAVRLSRAMRRRADKRLRAFSQKQNAVHFFACIVVRQRFHASDAATDTVARGPNVPHVCAGCCASQTPTKDRVDWNAHVRYQGQKTVHFYACLAAMKQSLPELSRSKAKWLPRAARRRDGR